MSLPLRFNFHDPRGYSTEFAIPIPTDPRQGAVIGGIGSAFASTSRQFASNLFGTDAFPFPGGLVGSDPAPLRPPEFRQPPPAPQAAVAVEPPVRATLTAEQEREREEHKKSFYQLYSSNYRDVEYKKTKLIQRNVHTEAIKVLSILNSGRHPSESDIDPDFASSQHNGTENLEGKSLQAGDPDLDPSGQPRKRARKMPRRFYHYTRVYMLHNYSGTLALAYRPDAAAAESTAEADRERAGKPPRLVTCFEDVFDAMADVHYKKEYHIRVGLTEKILRDLYYNIPRNCVKAFVQTCKCQTTRTRKETVEEEQRRVTVQKVQN